MEKITAAGEGLLLYLKRESNAIASELDAPSGHHVRRATTRMSGSEADFRDYGIGAQFCATWACAR